MKVETTINVLQQRTNQNILLYNALVMYVQYFCSKITRVGIQTAALLAILWISYGKLAGNKPIGYLFEFLLSITLAVI